MNPVVGKSGAYIPKRLEKCSRCCISPISPSDTVNQVQTPDACTDIVWTVCRSLLLSHFQTYLSSDCEAECPFYSSTPWYARHSESCVLYLIGICRNFPMQAPLHRRHGARLTTVPLTVRKGQFIRLHGKSYSFALGCDLP